MERTPTHPAAEKQQIKFHHQNADLGDGKEAKVSAPPGDLKIRQDVADLLHEFEIQYEQCLNNIGAAKKRA